MDAFRSILLPVPEVEALVDPYRRASDWSRRHGVPAHQTLTGPFPLDTPLPRAALAELAAAMRGARYELRSAGTLGDALALFPGDDAPLLGWRERALAVIGGADEVDEEWRLHLTVCRPDSADEGEEIARRLERSLPIACEVGALLLAERDAGGRVSVRALG